MNQSYLRAEGGMGSVSKGCTSDNISSSSSSSSFFISCLFSPPFPEPFLGVLPPTISDTQRAKTSTTPNSRARFRICQNVQSAVI